MKIEKVNDHQIRCTLTKADLADRELKISELAYGTEKAKDLFRDMMQQANFEFGFEAEDIPLMIEAIPLSTEAIVLIITKVEDPEELDTRFSKFAPSVHENESGLEDVLNNLSESADDVLDLFKRLHQEKARSADVEDSLEDSSLENISSLESDDVLNSEIPVNVPLHLTKIYSFTKLDHVTRVAHVLRNYYNGRNSLYKDSIAGKYLLLLGKSDHTPEEFNKICNVLSEYGTQEKSAAASESYLEEHLDVLLKDSALQSLKNI